MSILRISNLKHASLNTFDRQNTLFLRNSSSFFQNIKKALLVILSKPNNGNSEVSNIQAEFEQMEKFNDIQKRISKDKTSYERSKLKVLNKSSESISAANTTTNSYPVAVNIISKQTNVDISNTGKYSSQSVTPTRASDNRLVVETNKNVQTKSAQVDPDEMRRRVREMLAARAGSKKDSSKSIATAASTSGSKTLFDSINSIKSELPQDFVEGTYVTPLSEADLLKNQKVSIIRQIPKVHVPFKSRVDVFNNTYKFVDAPKSPEYFTDEITIKLKSIIRDNRRTMFEEHQINDFVSTLDAKFKMFYKNGHIVTTGGSAFKYAVLGDPVLLLAHVDEEVADKKDINRQVICVKTCLKELGINYNEVKNNPQIIHVVDSTKQFIYLIYVGSVQRLSLRYLMNFYHRMDKQFADLIFLVKIWLKNYDKSKKLIQMFSDDVITMLVLHYFQINNILPNLHVTHKDKVNLDNIFRTTLEGLTSQTGTISANQFSFDNNEEKRNIFVLFEGFINYYKEFDWKSSTINMTSGTTEPYQKKPKNRNPGNIIEPFYNNGFFNIAANDDAIFQLSEILLQTSNQLKDPKTKPYFDIQLGSF